MFDNKICRDCDKVGECVMKCAALKALETPYMTQMMRGSLAELQEAKRLLKLAVDALQDILCQTNSLTVCFHCIRKFDTCYGGSDCEHEAKWEHLEEALKLIEED